MIRTFFLFRPIRDNVSLLQSVPQRRRPFDTVTFFGLSRLIFVPDLLSPFSFLHYSSTSPRRLLSSPSWPLPRVALTYAPACVPSRYCFSPWVLVAPPHAHGIGLAFPFLLGRIKNENLSFLHLTVCHRHLSLERGVPFLLSCLSGQSVAAVFGRPKYSSAPLGFPLFFFPLRRTSLLTSLSTILDS